jgi:uncharacterized membrane protein
MSSTKPTRRPGFITDFRQFFGRGLAITLPTILTLALLWYAFTFLFKNVAEPINAGVRGIVLFTVPRLYEPDNLPEVFRVSNEQVVSRLTQQGRLPTDPVLRANAIESSRDAVVDNIRRENLRDYWADRWFLDATGLLVAILLIYLAGLLLSNFLGRRLYQYFERLLARVPGFKQVYPSVKQVVDLVLGENKSMAFKRVVLVRYPSPELWTLGFVTGTSLIQVRDQLEGDPAVSVFIPTSPTPMTGFVINVRESETVDTDITVEQALRFVVTAGVLTPENMGGMNNETKPRVDPRGDVPGQLAKLQAVQAPNATAAVNGNIPAQRVAETEPAAKPADTKTPEA